MKIILSALLVTFLLISCGSENKKTGYKAQVETLISQNKFNEALQYISSLPLSEESTELGKDVRVKNSAYLQNKITELKKTDSSVRENAAALAEAYVEMGVFMEYYGDHLGMKERMTGSLAHFRKALQLEPGNSKAMAEIEQIEGIYKQMGREVPQDIAD
ncbi:MAG: hypothetical protein GW823_07230 [Bacteroidetes bacterium]|nr:hypothetical protein [Bacteroidota bacterium]